MNASTASTMPVRVSAELISLARRDAKVFGRSVASQLEYWANLGRLFEAMPGSDATRLRRTLDGELDPSEVTDNLRVRDALMGKLSVQDLDEAEEELFYDVVGLIGPSETAQAFFAEMREKGGAVGLDQDGNLVRGLPGGATEPYKAPRKR